MIRMNFRDRNMVPTYKLEYRRMEKKLQSESDILRTGYPFTIKNLDAVFGQDEFFEFYENLFDTPAIQRLCDYLVKSDRPANFVERRNVRAVRLRIHSDPRILSGTPWLHRHRVALSRAGQQGHFGQI